MKPQIIIFVAGGFYAIGLLAQSWFGLIRPIENSIPAVWSLLKITQKIIVTTRDGLFEGFLFVGIGMLFAYGIFSISKKKSLWLFILSFSLLGVEAYAVKILELAREHDMYIFLVPATIFGFSYVKQIDFEDRTIFGTLRTMSSLIFYMHFWVAAVIGKLLRIISEPLAESGVKFIATLLVTIILSFIVTKLAKKPKFKWLNILWN